MIRTIVFGILFLVSIAPMRGQTADLPMEQVSREFKKLKTFTANILMVFDIPYVRLEPVPGKLYFRQPNDFKIKSEGIAFLPKQNPFYSMGLLSDPNAFTLIDLGSANLEGRDTRQIQMVPKTESDIVIGKVWIDPKRKRPVKFELTTRQNGTLDIMYRYLPANSGILPDEMVFGIDVGKFKMPKALTAELNSSSKTVKPQSGDTRGRITLRFSGVQTNVPLSDEVFK
jgi:outer membrane lipoprotein-sorting protein